MRNMYSQKTLNKMLLQAVAFVFGMAGGVTIGRIGLEASTLAESPFFFERGNGAWNE